MSLDLKEKRVVQAKNHQQLSSRLDSMVKVQRAASPETDSAEINQGAVSIADNEETGNQNAVPKLTHENIVELTERFMNTLVQPTDENYRVLNYATIDELMDAFSLFVDREVAAVYVDYYFHEEADGIYILPTETPPWFEAGHDYEVEQVSENKTVVNQHNESGLHGSYTVSIEFTYDGSAWRITGITHQY